MTIKEKLERTLEAIQHAEWTQTRAADNGETSTIDPDKIIHKSIGDLDFDWIKFRENNAKDWVPMDRKDKSDDKKI